MNLLIKTLLLLCVTVSSLAFGQYKVVGNVRDFHNKTPLSQAKVSLGKLVAYTDGKGDFKLTHVASGSYIINVSHPDCDMITKELIVDAHLHLQFELEHHVKDIEEVRLHTVHKKGGSVVVSTLDKTILDRNTTENLGNLLSNISGVSTLKTGNNIAKPIIHGLYGSRISILNNGVKLAEQEWGVEHAPNVDPQNAQHIDVLKGASALKYGGDAVGGVVILAPEILPKKDSLQGRVNLSGISNGRGLNVDVALAQTWKSGWAVKTGGSYKKLGDQKTRNYHLKNTGMDFSSFNFSVQKNDFMRGLSFDYYLTQQTLGILRDSDVATFSDYERAMTAKIPVYSGDFSYQINNPKQEVQHHFAKLSAYKRFEHFGKVTATYSFQYNRRKEFDLRRGDLDAVPSMDLALMTHQLSVSNLIERGSWSLESGVEASFQNNFSDPETQSRRLIPNYDQYNAGAFSVVKYKILPKLNVDFGLRYDYHFYDVTKWYDKSDWERYYADLYPEFYVKTKANRVLTRPKLHYHNASLSAGVDYQLGQGLNLKFNYARISRTPNIAELFADGLHQSAAIIERGNMALETETGNQFNLILDAKINALEGLRLSVNPYLFLTENFINQVPNGVLQPTQVGVFPVWIYQQISAKMYGVDVDLNWKLNSNFSYIGNFSYVHGNDQTHHQPLILMVPTHFTNRISFQNKEWNDFYLQIENRTFLQQDRFPIYNVSYQDYVNGEEVTKTLDLSTPPKGYSLWNLQLGLQLSKGFSTGLTINNVFNTAYRNYLNRMRYFTDDAGRTIIINFKYQF